MKNFRSVFNLILILLTLIILSLNTGISQSKITLTLQSYWATDGAGAHLIKLIKEFEKNNPNVEIKYVYIPFNELVPTLLQQSLTKTLPDIVFADNPDIPNLIKSGIFKDITNEVKEWGENNWQDFYKGHREVVSSNGRIFALQLGTNNLALFYRKKLLEKAGIKKAPETWNELLQACKLIKEKLGIYGIVFAPNASEVCTWQFEPFLWSNGGSLLELNDLRAIKALELWTNLIKNGYAPRDSLNVPDQGDITNWFVNGNVAMMINGCWEFGWHLTEDVLKKLGDVEVATIPVPTKGMRPIVPFGGECFGISSNTSPEKAKIAWEFLKFICSPQQMYEFCIASGYIPTRASVADQIVKAKPNLKPFLEQAKYALPRPQMGGIEKYPTVSSYVWTAIQRALTGAVSPKEAFQEASSKIRSLFTPQEFEYYKKMARELLNEARGK